MSECGWVDEWMDGWMDGWDGLDGRMDGMRWDVWDLLRRTWLIGAVLDAVLRLRSVAAEAELVFNDHFA